METSVLNLRLAPCCRCFVTVVLGVQFGRFLGMMGGVERMPLSGMRVMCGRFVITGFMMASGFAMVLCGLLVMLRRLEVMLRCLFGHVCLQIFADLPDVPELYLSIVTTLCHVDETWHAVAFGFKTARRTHSTSGARHRSWN
jgi:hypothetical protein